MNKRLIPLLVGCLSAFVTAEDVNVHNFARAETDTYFRSQMAAFGAGIGQLIHIRDPITPENQTVIRQNQDTIYSGVILDLSQPVTITLPDTGERYQSMHVISQDHYMFAESAPGSYVLTEELVGSRFAAANFRTFVVPGDPEDVAAAHRAQDGIIVEGGGMGPYEAPQWNQEDLTKARQALSSIAELGFNSRYAFGRKDEVEPVDFLVGVAAGWGGLPARAAMYSIGTVPANDGETVHALTVRDVPVNAFWSITVYTADGYLGANDLGVNSYNISTAKPNEDGSFTLHFGACEDGRENCIPITPGWSYTTRLYEPREEIVDGRWSFPQPEPLPR